jgi:3-oxoacyl-[acyl-carrier-protein] synthase-1
MGKSTSMDTSLKNVYITYGALVTPLGNTVDKNFSALKEGKSGIKKYTNSGFTNENWPLAKIEQISENRFDTLLRTSFIELNQKVSIATLTSSDTLVIVSTTKANIDVFPNDTFESGVTILKNELGIVNEPIIVSNACISGVVAINLAADYIRADKFKDVIVIGIDVVSDFVIHGFQSLYAISEEAAKPFDKERTGITLGEGVAIVILSSEKRNSAFYVKYLNGSSSNDANHISGPSRTGEGLVRSIQKTLERSHINKDQIDFISAHGTGTIYNDEMESIAFDRLELNTKSFNSLKGYFGHTLGAAGVIETIVCLLSMEHNLVFKSLGYTTLGTSKSLNLATDTSQTQVNTVLKTASGFGGGNASLILIKD